MATLPPDVRKNYTDEERAIIAGYLLHQRLGTLKALSSTTKGAEIETDIGLQEHAKYYSNCESYSRFLLYWLGYEVQRNMMYGQESLQVPA